MSAHGASLEFPENRGGKKHADINQENVPFGKYMSTRTKITIAPYLALTREASKGPRKADEDTSLSHQQT